MGKRANFAIGAAIAAGVGYLAGILTAPKSGKETRADIKAKANELKEKAEAEVDKAKSSATDALDDAKKKFHK